jgi:hypothetical protein
VKSDVGFEEAQVAMLEGELAKLAMDTDALLAQFEQEYTFHDDELSDDEAEDGRAGENEEALAGCVASTSAHLPVATGVYNAGASFASASQVGGPQEGAREWPAEAIVPELEQEVREPMLLRPWCLPMLPRLDCQRAKVQALLLLAWPQWQLQAVGHKRQQ